MKRKLFAAGRLGPDKADITRVSFEARTDEGPATCPVRVPAAFPAEELQANAVNICGRRGYHGPFLNESLYNWFGGIWAGQGDCYFCMNTKNVKAERIAQKGHV